jgi:mono/diheme cytochrome c family protein
MRPQVAGTVARGQLDEADSFYLGYDPAKLAAMEAVGNAAKLVSVQDGSAPAAGAAAPAAGATPPAAAPNTNLPWLDKLPIEANEANMKLGQTKFQIYCAACHGYGGYGDGLVHKRADALAQGFWIPPSSMHIDRIRSQPVGQIFHTITKGQGKMPGYAASLTPKERWAIALYVKALQKSQNASIDDIPVDKRSQLEPAAPTAAAPAAPSK